MENKFNITVVLNNLSLINILGIHLTHPQLDTEGYFLMLPCKFKV